MSKPFGDMHSRFAERMRQIEPGAVLCKRKRHWTVASAKHYATSTHLTLRHGRRTICFDVMICYAGPYLGPEWHCVSLPPTQKSLFA